MHISSIEVTFGMDKENQRIAITKRLLKESLMRLLYEKDLEKINITELCKDAGVNRATFYRHYAIPRDLLIEIQRDLYFDLKRVVGVPASQTEVEKTIEKLCRYLEEHAELLRVIIRNNTDEDFVVFINSIYAEIWTEISGVGIQKSLSDEDVKLLTLYCAGGSYFILRHWLLGNVHKTSKEMAAYVYEILNITDWVMLSTRMGLVSENWVSSK